MTFGARFYAPDGTVTFDSTTEHVLFLLDQRELTPASVGSGLTINFPGAAGKKVAAFMQSPYGEDPGPGAKLLTCRISYPGGVPTVYVAYDDPNGVDVTGSAYPKASGFLCVYLTGATQ